MIEIDFFISTIINLLINLTYTIMALLVGLLALKIVDTRLLKTISIEEELKKGNMAVSIFASTILIFVALIVALGLKG